MIQAVRAIVHFETSEVGANFDNWHMIVKRYDSKTGIIVIILACFYIPLIGLYLDQVLNSTFGVRKHPCFCFMPSYWRSGKARRNIKSVHVGNTTATKTDQNLHKQSS